MGERRWNWRCEGTIRPDLLVADYNLPKGLNGLQVVAELRETLGYEIPAIILTGDISTDTLREIAQGGHLHLNKPVKAKELMDLIRRCLAQPPPAAKASTRQPAELPADRDCRPSSWSTMTAQCARRCAICSSKMAGRSSSTPVPRRSSRPIVLAAKAASWSMPGCPAWAGWQLLQRLKSEGTRLPAIMITGQGDVPMAVEAMKAGAADFIEKPIGRDELFASIERALEHTGDSAKLSALREAAATRLAGLTARQRQIMELVLAGHPSKNIAADLGISQRTVENHRAAVMKKTGSHSLSALIRLALAADPGTAAQSLG